MIARLVDRLFGSLRDALAAGLAITGYTLLVGAAPAVVRAASIGVSRSSLARRAAAARINLKVEPQPWQADYKAKGVSSKFVDSVCDYHIAL